MKFEIPFLIQGGMGAGVSNWRLSQAVSRLGHLGVVAGTALDQLLSRRLQEGDTDGSIRRALEHFPFPKVAQRILDLYFIPGGRDPSTPPKPGRMHTVEHNIPAQELCMAANFVEIFLAREGHSGPVGINFLEKIQMPHLPSLYGAMLAGVAVIIVGAGIPLEFPAAIDALANHQPATYTVHISGPRAAEPVTMTLDPAHFFEAGQTRPPLPKPAFLPIISSATLATMLVRRVPDGLAGFVVEDPVAGGHNAPPRGQTQFTADGQPIYGPRDVVNLDIIRKIGLPFWLAGGYGSPEKVKEARDLGAAGVQVGTAFALCQESGLAPAFRHALISKALAGTARVFTDAKASPTGFPFKVGDIEGTLSDDALYRQRQRICNLGFLREAYRRPDGTIGYRCAAEPEAAWVAKGGGPAATTGRKCLCNALVANIGLPGLQPDGSPELALVTIGDDLAGVGRFCTNGHLDYTAADVVRILLG
ncbi:MAG: nitronate monooxygenase [Kiritimatiellae bacterium]|nr:nitronate monooxygenase [Kiritimatiellia bacterium]